jgi:hypothetical protein
MRSVIDKRDVNHDLQLAARGYSSLLGLGYADREHEQLDSLGRPTLTISGDQLDRSFSNQKMKNGSSSALELPDCENTFVCIHTAGWGWMVNCCSPVSQ